MALPRFPRWMVGLSAFGTGFGLLVLYKDRAPRYEGNERLEGRTVVVTGANSGIGKETAENLAKRGGRILMACRDLKKCEEVRAQIVEATLNQNVHCRPLDLGSMKSVRQFAKDINQNEKRLDVLINNAGVMACPKAVTEDGFELQLAVNHLGPFLLTHLLLDKLKESAPSRIINVTSSAYVRGQFDFDDFNGLSKYEKEKQYYRSKLASIYFTKELAKQLEGTNVSVFSVNPGITRTKIGRHLGSEQSSVSSTILGPLWWLLMRRPLQGAQTSIHCAVQPGLEKHSGGYFEDCRLSPLQPIALDEAKAQRVWLISQKWTQLSS